MTQKHCVKLYHCGSRNKVLVVVGLLCLAVLSNDRIEKHFRFPLRVSPEAVVLT